MKLFNSFLLHFLLLSLLLSCSKSESIENYTKESTDEKPSSPTRSLTAITPMCWKGLINNKIPVTIHYNVEDSLLIGELTYTKKNIPIRLIGTIEMDHSLRLCEYDPEGNITGIIEGFASDSSFAGTWYSTKTQKKLDIQLKPYDSTITYNNNVTRENIYGDYRYSYGHFHTQGDLSVKRINDSLISFSILSTGQGEAPNIAQVEEDTIALTSDSFTYTIPDSDNCEFKIRFYKDFAFIEYTKGYCSGQFGLNTSIDGIFIKTKPD